MKAPPPDTVTAWIGAQVARFHHTNQAATPAGRTPRDPALIQAAIEALCDATCPWAASVREYIDRRVAGMEDAA